MALERQYQPPPGVGSLARWIFAALLTLFFPKMVEAFPPSAIFGFFCFVMVPQLLWIKFFVPETKGVSRQK